jgi:dTMP kinase
MYIVLEGIDSCGKTTQIDKLRMEYQDAFFTKEPYDSYIREIALYGDICDKSKFFIFLADRAEHINKCVLPNIQKLIISDRSLVSGVGYAINVDIEKAIEMNLLSVEGVLPDFVFMFVIDREILENRLMSKRLDKIESKGIDYLLSIQERMINVLKMLSIPHKIINSNDSIDNIYKNIKGEIDEKIANL